MTLRSSLPSEDEFIQSILILSFVVVQDKTVNWHSTPFETRLEKALSRSSTQA
ncbi:unnamed protein product [Rhodiola kirilowii]